MFFGKLLPTRDFVRVENKFYPEFIYCDSAISDGVKSLYVYFFNKNIEGSLTINNEALAQRLNVTEKTVRNHIKVLATNQYVEVTSNGFKKANTYTLMKNPTILKFMQEEFFMKKHQKNSSYDKLTKKNLQGKNYRLKKELNILTPLTPQSEADQSKLIQVQENVAEVKSQSKLDDFNKIAEAYPNKECLKVARRVYFSLLSQANLPSCSALLEIIERFKQEDSRWKNGYVPMLKNFLRYERYKEEPLVRELREHNLEQNSYICKDNKTPKEEKAFATVIDPCTLLREKFDQNKFNKTIDNYLTFETKKLSANQTERVVALNKKWAEKLGRSPEIEGYIKAVFANSNNPEGYLLFAEDNLKHCTEDSQLPLGKFMEKYKELFQPFFIEDYIDTKHFNKNSEKNYLDNTDEAKEEYFKTAVSY